MKLNDLNDIAKNITSKLVKDTSIDMSIKLDSDRHESLQQEVYRYINKTNIGYKSRKKFDIIIGDIAFLIIRT